MQNIFNLKGKRALVIGASSGIGERFARVLSDNGADVMLASRNTNKLDQISVSLPNSKVFSVDVANKESVKELFMALTDSPIDICINTAALAKVSPVFEENELTSEMINTNVLGSWYVAKYAAIHMKEHAIAGSIINVASVNGRNKLRTELSIYAMSKAAVIQMTKAMVGELSPFNIRINCISPGLIHTPLTDYKLHASEMREEMLQKIPLNTIGQVEDLDGVLLFLCSNSASRYVTGTNIEVDGGVSWGGQ